MSSLKKMLDKIKDRYNKNEEALPLYEYKISEEEFIEIQNNLIEKERGNLQSNPSSYVCAAFVLWASLYICNKIGDQVTWKNVFDGLNINKNISQAKKTDIVRKGLKFWDLTILHYGDKDHPLYTLATQGGLPVGILKGKDASNLKDVLEFLIKEFEKDPNASDDVKREKVISKGKTAPISDAYAEDPDLFVKTIKVICDFREDIEDNSTDGKIKEWLDQYEQNWLEKFPFNIFKENKDAFINFIQEAIKLEKPKKIEPLCLRLLSCNEKDEWQATCRMNRKGILESKFLPESCKVKFLHLEFNNEAWSSPIGGKASPKDNENEGWAIDCQKEYIRPLSLDGSISIEIYDDGEVAGKGELLPALDGISFWEPNYKKKDGREGDKQEDDNNLLYVGALGKTARDYIYCLTSAEDALEIEEGNISILESFSFKDEEDDKKLWKLSSKGKAKIRINDNYFEVETKIEGYKGQVHISPEGTFLKSWYDLKSNVIMLGEPRQVWFSEDNRSSFPLTNNPRNGFRYKIKDGRNFYKIVKVFNKDDVLYGGIRILSLPSTLTIKNKEDHTGAINCTISGLSGEWDIDLKTNFDDMPIKLEKNDKGDYEGHLPAPKGSQIPANLILRLREAGKVIDIMRHYPAKKPYFVQKIEGYVSRILERQDHLFLDDLENIIAIAPDTGVASFKISLNNQGKKQESYFDFYSQQFFTKEKSFFKQLLAQGTPDAQIKISFKNEGKISLNFSRYKRLEYERDTTEGEDKRILLPEVFNSQISTIIAVMIDSDKILKENLKEEDIIKEIKLEDGVEYVYPKEFLSDGRWMLYITLNGEKYRPLPCIIDEDPGVPQSRNERINYYKEKWHERLNKLSYQECQKYWLLIKTASDAGDVGVLDEIRALSDVPEVILCLLFLVDLDKINDEEEDIALIDRLIELNEDIPLFWPIVKLDSFAKAIEISCKSFLNFLQEEKGESDAENKMIKFLWRRIRLIIERMPNYMKYHWFYMMTQGFAEKLFKLNEEEAFKAHRELNIDPDGTIGERIQSNGMKDDPSRPGKPIADREKYKLFWKIQDQFHLCVGKKDLPEVELPINLKRPNWRELFKREIGGNSRLKNLLQAPFIAADYAFGKQDDFSYEEKFLLNSGLLFLRSYNEGYFDKMFPLILATYNDRKKSEKK